MCKVCRSPHWSQEPHDFAGSDAPQTEPPASIAGLHPPRTPRGDARARDGLKARAGRNRAVRGQSTTFSGDGAPSQAGGRAVAAGRDSSGQADDGTPALGGAAPQLETAGDAERHADSVAAVTTGVTDFYVYALTDPREADRPFYIGKGRGDRVAEHERAVRGRYATNQAKRSRIEQIVEAGLQVGRRILRGGLDEAAALRLERELIAATPGLTNVMPGVEATGCCPDCGRPIVRAKTSAERMRDLRARRRQRSAAGAVFAQ